MIDCTFENGGKTKLRHVVVDTLILKDSKILLVKRHKKLSEPEKWGLAGGFMERDERIEQAAAREALEETGWQVKDMTLMRIVDNPNRPTEDRQNVAFVYFATTAKKVGEADWESHEQKWFDLDELPPKDQIAFDHAEQIEFYKKYLKENFKLPVVG